MNAVLLIAHAPLAQALRQAALHVFADAGGDVLALDVLPDAAPEDSLTQAENLLAGCAGHDGVLILTDMLGATPCNVATRLLHADSQQRLLTGVNLPMLLRALSYRHEPLDALTERALTGGQRGMGRVPEPASA